MRYAIDMAQIRIVLTRAVCLGHLGAILAAGCTVVSPPPPGGTPTASVTPEVGAKPPPQEAAATQPPPPTITHPSPSITQPPPTITQPQPSVTGQAAPVVVPPAPPDSARERLPSAPAAGRVPAAPAEKSVATASSAPKPPVVVPPRPLGSPPLDLKSLETRLKETKAIGVYTKLTLKNQVDDLLDDFRAYYKGQLKTTLADLRRAFDLLVMKVLALLQDADPQLASAIAASREAIWGILSDPVKFAAV